MRPYTQISNFELRPALLFDGGTQAGDPGGGKAGGKRPTKKKTGGKKKTRGGPGGGAGGAKAVKPGADSDNRTRKGLAGFRSEFSSSPMT